MQTVGWLGLGKLGMTCALAMEQHGGVEIVGYDPDPAVRDILNGTRPPGHKEQGLSEMIAATTIELAANIDDVVSGTSGLVFCSVQTPHQPRYGGEVPMPATRADFDYRTLVEAAESVSEAADRLGRDVTLVIISTCLPGTVRRLVLPVLSDRVTVVYNPFFIAMGTTLYDFLDPEFILIGADDPVHAKPLIDLYFRLHGVTANPYGPQVQLMTIESAELTKVAYNTFISMKIVFANTLMQICTDIPNADVDQVTNALGKAKNRIVSPKYLTAGMGDGGACHPRDNIAMAWLAATLGVENDPFEFVTQAREAQTRWLASIVDYHYAMNSERPVILLGKSYKPDSDLTYGSPALLLAHYLGDMGIPFEHWDWNVDGSLPDHGSVAGGFPATWVICTRHPEYADLKFPDGSVVIDPFRFVCDQHESVQLVRLGARED